MPWGTFAPPLYCASPSCWAGDTVEPWCGCTSDTFCSEVMLPLPIAQKRNLAIHSHAISPSSPCRPRSANQTGFAASEETISSCTRTDVFYCYGSLRPADSWNQTGYAQPGAPDSGSPFTLTSSHPQL